MSADFFIPLAEPQGATTHVAVSVSHMPSRKSVVLAVYPAESNGNGLYSIEITAGKYTNLEPMPRLNRKKLDQAKLAVKGQLDSKTGPAWEQVQALAADKGLKL